jgi:2-polyprenyl-3-methyl-5-hydroxy-6-metoxy-1,4-benzoquinol methylase
MLAELRADVGAKPTSDKQIFTLLDVGCGLMDNGLHLRRLAARYNIDLQITGIDPGHVIGDMMGARRLPEGVRFEPVYLSELVTRGEIFDFVISNHLLHHLDDDELRNLLAQVGKVTRKRAVMNDLSRSAVSWAFFGVVSWPARGFSFLAADGMRSIRRSYRPEELRPVLPQGAWKVYGVWPFRLIAVFDGPSLKGNSDNQKQVKTPGAGAASASSQLSGSEKPAPGNNLQKAGFSKSGERMDTNGRTT